MATICNGPGCEKPLQQTPGKRARLYCGPLCRNKASKARRAAGIEAQPVVQPVSQPPRSDLAGVISRQLEQAGRAETIPGQLAIAMARQIDSASTPASSMASLSKEVRSLVSEALAGVTRPGDEDAVDQARTVRDRKLRAVG